MSDTTSILTQAERSILVRLEREARKTGQPVTGHRVVELAQSPALSSYSFSETILALIGLRRKGLADRNGMSLLKSGWYVTPTGTELCWEFMVEVIEDIMSPDYDLGPEEDDSKI